MSLELYLLAYTWIAYWDVLQQVSLDPGLQQVVLPILAGFVRHTLRSTTSCSQAFATDV